MMQEEVNNLNILQLLQVFKKIIFLLKKNFLIILLGGIFGVLLYSTFFFLKSPKYIGKASFIMREKSVSTSTALSNIATQLGVDLSGSSNAGSVFAGENILDILKSNTIITRALLNETDNKTLKKQSLADLYLSFSSIRKKLKDESPEITNVNYPIHQIMDSFSNAQDTVMQLIIKKVANEKNLIIERSNKKATIIKVEVISKNKDFSRIFPKRLIEEATDFYVTTKTSVLEKDIAKMQQKADSIIALLKDKSYLSAELTETDLNPALNTATVPVELAQRDKAVLFRLYGEVVKQLEMARADLIREKPIIQIIDTPGITLYNHKKFSFILAIFMGIIMALFTAGFIIIKDYINQKIIEANNS